MNLKHRFHFLIKLSELFDPREKREFLGIAIAALLMALFQALGIASILPFIALVMDPAMIFNNAQLSWVYETFYFQSTQAFIIAAGIAMLLIIIMGNLVSALAIWLKTRFVWRKNHNLSTALLRRYVFLPYAFFLDQNTSDLSKNILSEVNNLTGAFLMPILEIFTDSVIIVFIFITLILVSPMATVVLGLVCLTLYMVLSKSNVRSSIKHKGSLRLKENQYRYKIASEALSGIKDVKLLGKEDFFIDHFAEHSQRFSKLQANNAIIGQLPRYFLEIIAFGGTVVFVLVLILTHRDFNQIIPLISFFAFAGYRLMPTVNKMLVAFTRLQFNRAVLDRIHKDLIGDIRSDILSEAIPKDCVSKIHFQRNIALCGLGFAYPGSKKFVFQDIDLMILKNTSVAIVGPTGCGKTTLVDILLGLLRPCKGTLNIDGVDIDQHNLRAWQQHLGYVPQFIYLCDDTVKRNIAFGMADKDMDMDKIQQAAKIANLDDFIVSELPHGYDTMIGERGIRLSGGQRQRVGIARALYHNPDVLVFDEATSSLDGATEDAVLQAIDNIAHTKTIIMIAHRLTTVKGCDQIYLLDQGRILAQGTYQELIQNNPQFQSMAGETKQKA